MNERNEAEGKNGVAEEAPAGGRDIRFLKEKQRKGPGALVFAVLLLVAGIIYALFVRSAMLAPKEPTGVVVSDELAASMLVDRFWIDRIPEAPMDKFNFYIFSSEDDIALNDQAQSIYRHLLEIFVFKASARDIQYQFPHDRRKGKTAYTIEKLARPDENQIDLKLTLTADPQSGGKSHVYYTSTKWQSHDRSTLPVNMRELPDVPHPAHH